MKHYVSLQGTNQSSDVMNSNFQKKSDKELAQWRNKLVIRLDEITTPLHHRRCPVKLKPAHIHMKLPLLRPDEIAPYPDEINQRSSPHPMVLVQAIKPHYCLN